MQVFAAGPGLHRGESSFVGPGLLRRLADGAQLEDLRYTEREKRLGPEDTYLVRANLTIAPRGIPVMSASTSSGGTWSVSADTASPNPRHRRAAPKARPRAAEAVGAAGQTGYWGPMSPRHPGWQALAEAVAPGARVTRLRRLAGAGMTDAYDVTLDRAPRRVVVKLYRDGDGTAPLEWSRLGFAQRVALPVPETIVADLEAVWFDSPTVVMSRLPGRPDLMPKDVESSVGAL